MTTPPPPPAHTDPGSELAGDDLVRRHVTAVLQHWIDRHTEFERTLAALEAKGKRIVDGGQDDADAWKVTDHRTGTVLASGTGGHQELSALLDTAQAADWEWANDHIDDVYGTGATVTTEGLPESLCTALTDWADARSTPHQEVAEFVGWPAERVQAARDDL